jgi:hypothetical protein
MPAQHPVLKRGVSNIEAVLRLQRRLNELGCGPIDEDGVFGAGTKSAVAMFQTRRGLLADGIVGPHTWAALFPTVVERAGSAVVERAGSAIGAAALAVAVGQLGVREHGMNRGPEIDEYVRRVGLDPAGQHAWCQAFVYWCFDEGAKRLGVANPCVRTASCMDHWIGARQKALVVPAAAAADDPGLVNPGAVFVIDHGHDKGHVGFVERVHLGRLITIEGNTNVAGSREGDGIFRRARSFFGVNLGFVEYR